ncbi:hypothetical protein COOONC_25364 [Cooperia oncophora]
MHCEAIVFEISLRLWADQQPSHLGITDTFFHLEGRPVSPISTVRRRILRCSSTEAFKSVDYTNAREPFWCFALSRTNRPNDAAMLGLCGTDHVAVEPTHFVFPRIITVIRNGVKPRRVVRHLLNKKTARYFILYFFF